MRREKHKKSASTSGRPRSLNQQRAENGSQTGSEPKEVKFMSFVKKLDENISVPATVEQSETIRRITSSEKEADKKSIAFTTSEEPNQEEEKLDTLDTTNKQIKQTKCLHTDNYQCECCKYPPSPMVSFTNNNQTNNINNKRDIFHLTSAHTDILPTFTTTNTVIEDSQTTLNKLTNPQNTTLTTNQEAEGELEDPLLIEEKRLGLREILISNYDPKFATKIGIRDFLPIQVMTSHLEGEKDLDFIPFEDIDHSYPK